MKPLRNLRTSLLTILLGGLPMACQSGTASLGEVPTPAIRLEVEKRWNPLYRQALQAELLRALGEEDEAEEIARHLITREPLFVPAWRLHQDYLRERGRMGRVWVEIAELRKRFPDRPEPIYLETRLIPDFPEKVRRLTEAWQRFPNSYWILYGLAWCRSFDPSQREWSRQLLARLLESNKPWPQTWALYWQTQPGPAETGPALEALRQDAAKHPESGLLALLLYLHGEGRLSDLLAALDKGPGQPGLLGLLASDKVDRHRDVVLRHLESRPQLTRTLLRSGGSQVLAFLALAEGRPALAERWLREPLEREGRVDSVLRSDRLRTNLETLCRLLCSQGRLGEAIEAWKRAIPQSFLQGDGNLGSRRLHRFLNGPCKDAVGVPEDPERALEQLEILIDMGWVEEAMAHGSLLRRRHPDHRRIRELLDEAESFLRFETELIEDLRGAHARSHGLQGQLDRAREISVRIFGRDLVGRPRIHEFPILGMAFVDPFGPGLPELFARFHRYLILGEGLGEGVPFLIGRKLLERRLRPSQGMPLLWECREVLLESKLATNMEDANMADPAGVALWNHYMLDLSMVRAWVRDLEEARRLGEGGELEELLEDPVPKVPAEDRSRPCQVDRKLAAKGLIEGGIDRDRVWEEVLVLLRKHERAHLVDAHRYLPVLRNPFSALGLAFQGGFSAEEILALAEARAEIAAIADGADPYLGLSHLASFLPEPGGPRGGPHARGFQRVLSRIVALWKADGAPGAKDPEHNLYAQLHRLTPERIREYAHTVSKELGFW